MTNEQVTVLQSIFDKAKKNGFRPILIDDNDQGVNDLIFSHEFAKAIWGEEEHYNNGLLISLTPAWQYHLQRLVLAEDRIAYLKETVNE
jgi:hypothetical protein